jgi:hypothetical protein
MALIMIINVKNIFSGNIISKNKIIKSVFIPLHKITFHNNSHTFSFLFIYRTARINYVIVNSSKSL